MAKLTFEIKASPETNDHEVVVLVDDKPMLDDDHMGVDPPAFFAQFSKSDVGQLVIGRCRCGVVGCGDYTVTVETFPDSVSWRGNEEIRFDRSQYEAAVRNASVDFSWEDVNRRAERRVSEILKGCRTVGGFVFQWASARIAPMSISFLRGDEQMILEFGWDGATDDSAIQGAERFRNEACE